MELYSGGESSTAIDSHKYRKMKLENIAMEQKIFDIFIRGGSTVNINILLG